MTNDRPQGLFLSDLPNAEWVKYVQFLERKAFGLPPITDDTGYEQADPKHPTYHERMADVWDSRADK